MNRKLSPREASAVFTREVIRSAWAYPGLFSRKIAIKILALFNRFESADNYHIGFISDYIRFFKQPFIAFWSVLPIGMIGLVATFNNSEHSRFMAGIFLLYSITLIIFFTNVRIRMPLAVILIPMAACGLESVLNCVKKRQFRKLVTLTVVGIGFCIIGYIPIPGTDDLTGHYNTHAVVLNKQGKAQEAIYFWKKSSQMDKPYSAFANLSLAKVYLRMGKVEWATRYLNKIRPDSFAAAQKYELTGDIFLRQKSYQSAVTAYEKSLSINSARLTPRRKLIELYRKTDPARANEARNMLAYVSSFY